MVNSYAAVIAQCDLPIDKTLKDFSKQIIENPKVVEAFKELNAKERRFALAKGTGCDMTDASRIAGYKTKNCRVSGYKLLQSNPLIQKAIEVIELEVAFTSGIPALMKRVALWELFQDQRKTAPAAAVSAMKLLAQLDGDIVNESAGKGSITINITGLGLDQQLVIKDEKIVSEQ